MPADRAPEIMSPSLYFYYSEIDLLPDCVFWSWKQYFLSFIALETAVWNYGKDSSITFYMILADPDIFWFVHFKGNKHFLIQR